MQGTKLVKFITKRVLIFLTVLAILDIVFIGKRWYVLAGLLLGSALGVLRFGSYSFVFSKIIASVSETGRKTHSVRNSILIFVINQLILFPAMFAAYVFDRYFFGGLVCGILLVPFVLFVNSITEPLKITHNNFE